MSAQKLCVLLVRWPRVSSGLHAFCPWPVLDRMCIWLTISLALLSQSGHVRTRRVTSLWWKSKLRCIAILWENCELYSWKAYFWEKYSVMKWQGHPRVSITTGNKSRASNFAHDYHTHTLDVILIIVTGLPLSISLPNTDHEITNT